MSQWVEASKASSGGIAPKKKGDINERPTEGDVYQIDGVIFYIQVKAVAHDAATSRNHADLDVDIHFKDGTVKTVSARAFQAYSTGWNTTARTYDGMLSLFALHNDLAVDKVEVVNVSTSGGHTNLSIRWGSM